MNKSIRLKLFAVALCCLLPLGAHAQHFSWFVELSEINSEFDQIVAYEDYLYAVGGEDGDGALLIKYGKDGSEVWRRLFQVNNEPYTSAFAVTVTSEGVFVAGSYDPNAFVVKFTHSGDRIWTYIDDTAGTNGAFYSIAHDAAGIYVTGTMRNSGIIARSVLTRLDFDGNEVWTTDVPIDYLHRVSGGPLVVHDGMIYLYTGYDHLIHLYDVDGNPASNYPTSSPIESMAYFDGYLYAVELYTPAPGEYPTGDYTVVRYDAAGNATSLYEHSPPYPQGSVAPDSRANGLAVVDDGIFVLSKETYTGCCPPLKRLLLTKLDLDGQFTQKWLFPGMDIGPYPHQNIVVDDDRVFIGGTAGFHGFIAEVENEQVFPASQIRSLDTFSFDGYQDIAVMIQGTSTPQIHIKSIGKTPQRSDVYYFDDIRQASDFQILDTQFFNSPHLAVLGSDQAVIDIRNSTSTTRYLDFQTEFNRNITPIKFVQIPDQNNNGFLELGLLGRLNNQGGVVVEIRDSYSSKLLGSASFNPNYTPIDIALIQDLDGDSVPEIGLLSSKQSSKIEIRTLTGTLIKNIWLGDTYKPTHLVPLPPADAVNSFEAETLGVVLSKINGNGLAVKILDPVNGDTLHSVGYDWHYQPVKALALSDISANGAAEIALLGEYITSNTNTASTKSKVAVRDSSSGQLIRNVWQIRNATPVDMTVIPDVNGNQAPEIVTLMDSNTHFRVHIKDSQSSQLVDSFYFEKP